MWFSKFVRVIFRVQTWVHVCPWCQHILFVHFVLEIRKMNKPVFFGVLEMSL